MSYNNRLFKFAFGCNPEDVNKRILITPILSVKAFKKYLNNSAPFKGRLFEGCSSIYNKKNISVIKVPFGLTFTQDCVAFLKQIFPEKVLFLGACGGITDIDIGDWIIPNQAVYKDILRSPLYINTRNCPIIVRADKNVSDSLKDFLTEEFKQKGLNVHYGKMATVNSIFYQPGSVLNKYKNEDILGVDLESAGFLNTALSIELKVFAAALWVSDLPLKASLGSDKQLEAEKNGKDSLFEGFRAMLKYLAT